MTEDRKAKIRFAMYELDLYGKRSYSVGELKAIAKHANVDMFMVMDYARFEMPKRRA